MLRAILVLLAVVVALVAAETTTPVLMFASQQYFNQQKTNTNTITQDDFTTVLDAVIKGSATTNGDVATGLNAQQIPTTVVVMTVDKFTTLAATEALGLYGNPSTVQNIKDNFQFYYPNAVQSNTEQFYNNILVSAAKEQTSFDATAQCADVVTFLNTVAATHANAATKNNLFLQVGVADIALVNQCLTDITTALNTNTQSKYLLIVQGAVDATLSLQTLKDDPIPAKTRADGQVGPAYVTSGTLVALFTVFILLFFAFFGFGKLMDVEGPLRYPLTTPPNAREY